MRAHQIRPLNEINMSPRYLQREAEKIGPTVGIEFEMIVPNVSGNEDDELEPDYDNNPSARSIDAICDFYHDGDYNGRRAIQELRETMEDDYRDWFGEHAEEKWREVAHEMVRAELLRTSFDRDEAMADYMRTTLDLNDQQIAVALRAGRDASEITSSKQLRLFADDNDPYAAYRAADDAVTDALETMIEQEINDQGDMYQSLHDSWNEEFIDDNWHDLQEDWLESKGIESMSDVVDEYGNNIRWPYWTSESSGERGVSDVASDFEDVVTAPVKWSDSYHGVRRDGRSWIIEPDGSLNPNNSGDRGLEFVSPPMSLSDMRTEMDAVYKWAGRAGCYTNSSTGLHMNVSIPGYSRDKLDYVKLAVLLGDKHVLASFGRESNSYCKSAFEKVQQKGRANPDTVKKVFDLLKNKLNGIASTMIHTTYTDKYTSINVKDGYVEFRGPGGDYLEENIESTILPTLYRFVVALDAACDVDKYRQEYIKKLYKALNVGDTNGDTLELFARYSAGSMSRENWEQQLRRRQREREHRRSGGDQRWWWTVFRRDNPNFQIEVVGTNRDDAIAAARGVVGTGWRNHPPSDFVANIARSFQSDQSTEPVLPQHGGPDRRPSGEQPSREWIVRPQNSIRGVNVWGTNREQAIRVARMMFPSIVTDATSDSDLMVTPV